MSHLLKKTMQNINLHSSKWLSKYVHILEEFHIYVRTHARMHTHDMVARVYSIVKESVQVCKNELIKCYGFVMGYYYHNCIHTLCMQSITGFSQLSVEEIIETLVVSMTFLRTNVFHSVPLLTATPYFWVTLII